MNTQPKVLKWSVILGIIIVLNLFFNYALSLVYKSPEYNNFCPMEQVVTQPKTQNECTAKGGQWTENAYYGKPIPGGATEPAGYCDLQYTCRQNFEKTSKTYNRNVFVILVFLGALVVFAGNMFKGNDVISNGLALGGVLSFVIASVRYWSDANDAFRVLILLIALGLLFWVAMKKFRNAGVQS